MRCFAPVCGALFPTTVGLQIAQRRLLLDMAIRNSSAVPRALAFMLRCPFAWRPTLPGCSRLGEVHCRSAGSDGVGNLASGLAHWQSGSEMLNTLLTWHEINKKVV